MPTNRSFQLFWTVFFKKPSTGELVWATVFVGTWTFPFVTLTTVLQPQLSRKPAESKFTSCVATDLFVFLEDPYPLVSQSTSWSWGWSKSGNGRKFSLLIRVRATEEPTTLRIDLSSEIGLKLCSIDLSELVNMDMLEKTVCLLAKKDISALHLIRKLENDEIGTSFQRIQGKICLP